MIDSRFALSIHLLYILNGKQGSSSDELAACIGVNPVVIRKVIGLLTKSSILTTKEGRYGGTFFGRTIQEITLAEIFIAIYDRPLFRISKNETDPVLRTGNPPDLMKRINEIALGGLLKRLSEITVHELFLQLPNTSP